MFAQARRSRTACNSDTPTATLAGWLENSASVSQMRERAEPIAPVAGSGSIKTMAAQTAQLRTAVTDHAKRARDRISALCHDPTDPLGRGCLRDFVAAQRLADLQRSSSALSWSGIRLQTANCVDWGRREGHSLNRRYQDFRILFQYHGFPGFVGSYERRAARFSILVDAAGISGPRRRQALALFLRLVAGSRWPDLS